MPDERTIRVEQMAKILGTNGTYSENMWSRVRVVKVEAGKVTFRLRLSQSECNVNGIMHGGATATLVDFTSSLATYAMDRPWKYAGTSTDMSVTYAGAALIDSEIEIVSEIKRMGGQTVQTYTELRLVDNEKPGALIAFGTHTKLNTDAKFSPKL